ncbi:MAG: hypothetical protein WEA81_07315, partial [Dehalococcoidia bacterium]
MKLHPRRPSPAMVVACISLFVALGGTSIAAVQLGRNSVGSKHIKNGQVKRVDLARNAVTSAKILDASLLAKDFATGQLPKGDKGDPGPTAGFRTGNIFADPPSTPESTFIPTESFSLPVAGRLLLLGRVSASILCSMGSFGVDFGLYVDGVPIPGSGVDHDIVIRDGKAVVESHDGEPDAVIKGTGLAYLLAVSGRHALVPAGG